MHGPGLLILFGVNMDMSGNRHGISVNLRGHRYFNVTPWQHAGTKAFGVTEMQSQLIF